MSLYNRHKINTTRKYLRFVATALLESVGLLLQIVPDIIFLLTLIPTHPRLHGLSEPLIVFVFLRLTFLFYDGLAFLQRRRAGQIETIARRQFSWIHGFQKWCLFQSIQRKAGGGVWVEKWSRYWKRLLLIHTPYTMLCGVLLYEVWTARLPSELLAQYGAHWVYFFVFVLLQYVWKVVQKICAGIAYWRCVRPLLKLVDMSLEEYVSARLQQNALRILYQQQVDVVGDAMKSGRYRNDDLEMNASSPRILHSANMLEEVRLSPQRHTSNQDNTRHSMNTKNAIISMYEKSHANALQYGASWYTNAPSSYHDNDSWPLYQNTPSPASP